MFLIIYLFIFLFVVYIINCNSKLNAYIQIILRIKINYDRPGNKLLKNNYINEKVKIKKIIKTYTKTNIKKGNKNQNETN